MEENPDRTEDSALVPESAREIVATEIGEPSVPEGVSNEEAEEMENRAIELVTQLEASSGSKELALMDSMTSLGMEAQRSGASELALLRTRVGDLISQDGPGSEISKDLVNLRLALNEINPHELSRPGFFRRLLGALPFVSRLKPALKVLQRIAIRYENVSKQAQMIETKLREGRRLLVRDNVELRKLYEQVEVQQLPIRKNAYLGELIMGQLSDLVERSDDPLKAERLRSVLHDVSMRVQDLRTMEEVYAQFFVSIEMTRQNNNRLGQSVERTLSLATNMVTIGLAIQSALARQKQVLEATQRTQEFLGDLLVANAAAIKQHTQEIGDVFNNPVIAMDKITQAHNDLISAMDTADRLRQEGITTARENISKLTQLSADLQQRALGLRDQEEEETPSLEA